MSQTTQILIVPKVRYLEHHQDESGKEVIVINDYAPFMIDFELFLDGKKYANYDVDIYHIMDLLNTGEEYQRYLLWNCGCGVPDCAGIEELRPIGDLRQEVIKFRLFLPISTKDFEMDERENEYQLWDRKKRTKLLKISKPELCVELLRLCDEVEALRDNTQGLYMGVMSFSHSEPCKPLRDLRSYVNEAIEKYHRHQK